MESTPDAVVVTRRTYDEVASAYAVANADLPQSVVEAMERFVAALPTGALVADVGCGPGRDLEALRARGLCVFGVDMSYGMLRTGGLAGVVQADMTALPIRSGALDGIWCAAALLHVPRNLVRRTLAGFAAALRPSGVLHLSVSEGVGEGWERDPYLASGDRWFVHHEEAELTRLLGDTGLQVVETRRAQARRCWLIVTAVRQDVSSSGS